MASPKEYLYYKSLKKLLVSLSRKRNQTRQVPFSTNAQVVIGPTTPTAFLHNRILSAVIPPVKITSLLLPLCCAEKQLERGKSSVSIASGKCTFFKMILYK